MIDKITMFTCDFCGEVDYFPTNNVKLARRSASDKERGSHPWVFKYGKDFCCQECCDKWLKENK